MRSVLAAFVVGLLVGFAIARVATPVTEESRTPQQQVDGAGDPDRPKGGTTRDEDPALASAHARIARLEHELHGDPVAWPEDTPDLADPENYARELAHALEECNVRADIQGYDCTEPPCYAILRRDELAFSESDDWWATLKDCDYWNATYSPSVGITTDTVACPDGSKEGFTMLTVSPRDQASWLYGTKPDRAVTDNADKRRRARKQLAMESWHCKAD